MGSADGRRFGVRFPIGGNTRVCATVAVEYDKPRHRHRAMTDAGCRPLRTFAPIADREHRPDRLAELLECMADLLVEARRQGVEIAQHRDSNDPRVREAIARLTGLERSLGEVGVEAASVHQLLQKVHLI
jgi:hypothetical protein